MEGAATDGNRIHGLAELLLAQDSSVLAPVESWDPPYRGDIGLAIKADGTWLYQGSPITRMAMVRLFARVLRRDGDGRHYLVTPAERVDINVDDAPFLAVEMQVDGAGADQQLIFRTNVDDIVRCGPANPLFFKEEPGTGGLKPYVLVRNRLLALVTRAICYDLAELAVPNAGNGDTLWVWSGGGKFALAAGCGDTTFP